MTDTTARLATTAALSPANTYASGVLTAGSNAALSVDGVAVNAGDVILVKNEAAAANNGLYTVTAAGSAGAIYVLTRHVDMSTSSEFVGAFVPVGLGGTANSNSLWLANPATPFQLGTTAVPFTQLNAATSYTAGNGINIAGTSCRPWAMRTTSQSPAAASPSRRTTRARPALPRLAPSLSAPGTARWSARSMAASAPPR
jgi:hypothetical protein